MGYDVWKTLFTNDLDCDKYIYHYTSIENAMQIIASNQFIFSELNISNDLPEEKVRIGYIDKTNGRNIEDCTQAREINSFFHKRSELLRLLCFCVDQKPSPQNLKNMAFIHTNHGIDKYFDVTGRGFAAPSMWSRYNHKDTVCFIINKSSFERYLDVDAEFCKHKLVRYLDYDSYFEINSIKLADLYSRICLYNKRHLSLSHAIKKIPEYIEFNFFYKHIAWQSDCEYRYVAVADSSDDSVCITQFDKYVEGIVCNEDIDPADESMLINRINGICELKKISFRDKFYRLLEK